MALIVVVPIAVVVGSHAVAWALSLKTWNGGDTLTAADLNSNFDALKTALPPPPILCTKTVTLPANSHSYTTPAFDPTDCTPNTVPGAGYVGALSEAAGCNGFLNWTVNQPTATTPATINVFVNGSCAAPQDQYTFAALFVHP